MTTQTFIRLIIVYHFDFKLEFFNQIQVIRPDCPHGLIKEIQVKAPGNWGLPHVQGAREQQWSLWTTQARTAFRHASQSLSRREHHWSSWSLESGFGWPPHYLVALSRKHSQGKASVFQPDPSHRCLWTHQLWQCLAHNFNSLERQLGLTNLTKPTHQLRIFQ